MSPSVESFNEAKYKTLMDGLECSEVMLSKIDLGDRFDSEYFTKNYLHISEQLAKVPTKLIGKISTTVASAFYPAATQLYSIGDTAFARCVDCVNYPIISKDQDAKFEKIPYAFAAESKGISILKNEDIIITKVGTPCYASIITEYSEIALSRTVLGLTNIHDIDPYYLVIFLRCKYGFEQLFRQRELTIQYQLTLPRVKAINVYDAGESFQKDIRKVCMKFIECAQKAKKVYDEAHSIVSTILDLPEFPQKNISIKMKSSSFSETGRLDAEYYQPKFDIFLETLKRFSCKPLGGDKGIVTIKKSIEPGSEMYQDEGIPFVRVSDISKFEISDPEIHLPINIVKDISKFYPKKDTILFSKDGSVGIAYKLEEDSALITSGALLHLNVKNTKEILPDYLTLILNSDVVQLQAERDSNGAIIQHWKPSDIEKVIVPVFDMQIQQEIASKVQTSFALRRKSKKVLGIAKKSIEIAIEQSEDIAKKWLSEKMAKLEE